MAKDKMTQLPPTQTTLTATTDLASVHHYRAFGMVIRSAFALPELVPTDERSPDLIVRRAKVDRVAPVLPTLRTAEFTATEQYLGFASIAKYLIRDGAIIDVDVEPGFDSTLLGFSLLGPVMAVIVHLRGNLVLHGSALTVDSASAIFLGDKGAGKSTIAGAMIANGHQLLTDDVVAIDCEAQAGPRILPGYPMVKLTDAALDAFRLNAISLLPTEIGGFDKRRTRIDSAFPSAPSPARVAYVLARGETAAIEPLSPLEGYQAMLRYSYMTRFGAAALSGAAAAQHMRQCARLAETIKIARLVTPNSLARLADAVELVEGDMS
jgi:hypothetical protein